MGRPESRLFTETLHDSLNPRGEPLDGHGRGVYFVRMEIKPEVVRSIRKSLDWSQGELADALGTNRSVVASWETGRRRCKGTAARLLWMIAQLASGMESLSVLRSIGVHLRVDRSLRNIAGGMTDGKA